MNYRVTEYAIMHSTEMTLIEDPDTMAETNDIKKAYTWDRQKDAEAHIANYFKGPVTETDAFEVIELDVTIKIRKAGE